ncbi:hypothetical protein BG003_007721 [Podila horticola]|nr:hypothetical protein BG003_007721 [Podila horticola]
MGALAGRNRDTQRTQTDVFHALNIIRESEDKIIDHVIEIANKKRVSPAQVALAWLLSKPFVLSPIVGISKEEHLHDLIGALSVKLTEEECQYLEEPYVPKPLMPM